MNSPKLRFAVKFIASSLLVGSILGLVGAFAAHYFRAGIVYFTSLLSTIPIMEKGFFYYLAALSIAVFFVHILKSQVNEKIFHGVADSIYFAHRPDNELDVKTGVLSTVAAFVSASGGASVGQYGPLVHFGATIGSWLKKALPLKLPLDLFLGGGVAAAISSGFGAPLAGVIFAHEAIMRHYSHKAILAIAVASCVAYGISSTFWTHQIIFPISNEELNFLKILCISFFAGPFFGIVSIIFMKSLQISNLTAARFSNFPLLKYSLGIFCLSIIGHFFPQVMGLGAEAVMDAASGNFPLLMVSAILVLKIVSTSISLGFGFFGGIFSPAILVGASAGAFVSELLLLVGVLESFEPALVISGMAAVTGAVVGAPICLVIIVMELTSSYTYALSSLVGLVLSASFTNILFGTSFFDVQLASRGIDISQGRTGIFMMEKNTIDYASLGFEGIYLGSTIKEAKNAMLDKQKNEIIVTNNKSQFVGKLELYSIVNGDDELLIDNFVNKHCVTLRHDASLQQAMEVAANFVGDFIPIINRDSNIVVATITEGAIFEVYLDVQNTVIDNEKR